MLPFFLPSVHLLVLHGVFVGLSLNYKRIAIGGVERPDVWRDVVEEILSLATLGSPTSLVRCRVPLPNVESSSNHPLDPGQIYLL